MNEPHAGSNVWLRWIFGNSTAYCAANFNTSVSSPDFNYAIKRDDSERLVQETQALLKKMAGG
jgi:hypothetical protein